MEKRIYNVDSNGKALKSELRNVDKNGNRHHTQKEMNDWGKALDALDDAIADFEENGASWTSTIEEMKSIAEGDEDEDGDGKELFDESQQQIKALLKSIENVKSAGSKLDDARYTASEEFDSSDYSHIHTELWSYIQAAKGNLWSAQGKKIKWLKSWDGSDKSVDESLAELSQYALAVTETCQSGLYKCAEELRQEYDNYEDVSAELWKQYE